MVLVSRMAQVKLGRFRVARVPDGCHAVEDSGYFVSGDAVVDCAAWRVLAETATMWSAVAMARRIPKLPRDPLTQLPPAPSVGEVRVIHPYQVVQGDDDAPSAHADGEKVVQGVVHVGVEGVDDPGTGEDVLRRGNVVR